MGDADTAHRFDTAARSKKRLKPSHHTLSYTRCTVVRSIRTPVSRAHKGVTVHLVGPFLRAADDGLEVTQAQLVLDCRFHVTSPVCCFRMHYCFGEETLPNPQPARCSLGNNQTPADRVVPQVTVRCPA